MNGADIFVESLLKEGVDTIFGHPAEQFCRLMTPSTVVELGIF